MDAAIGLKDPASQNRTCFNMLTLLYAALAVTSLIAAGFIICSCIVGKQADEHASEEELRRQRILADQLLQGA